MPRVVVVGGGVSGLAAAHRLLELERAGQGGGVEVTLLEEAPRLGGTIGSERVDGFLVEAGPDSFISEKPWALELCHRLGIEDRLIGTRPENRRTYVLSRGRLHPLPEGLIVLAPTRFAPLARSRLLSWPGKLRIALDLVLPRGSERADESLGSFVTRRLGREALERLAEPLVGGIYAADPDRLSLAATMPRFLELERRHRSLILGLRAAQRARGGSTGGGASGARYGLFVSLREGMGEMIEALAGRLPEGAVRLGGAAVRVAPGGGQGGRWGVELAGGEVIVADAVVLAVPAHRAAELVGELDPDLAAALAAIPYQASATLSLAYRREQVGHALDGFGFVVPRAERRPLLACTFASVKYAGRAPEGHVLLRAFLGGSPEPPVLSLPDSELEAVVRAELEGLLRLQGEPIVIRLHRHPRSMPQYLPGHLDRVAEIEALARRHRGLALAGSGYRGVGIPDCVRSGELAAEAALAAAA